MVARRVSEARGETRGGSSPLPGTKGDTFCLKDTNRLIDRANLGVQIARIAPSQSIGEY